MTYLHLANAMFVQCNRLIYNIITSSLANTSATARQLEPHCHSATLPAVFQNFFDFFPILTKKHSFLSRPPARARVLKNGWQGWQRGRASETGKCCVALCCFPLAMKRQKGTHTIVNVCIPFALRKVRDSNPRYPQWVYRISSPAHSVTLPTFLLADAKIRYF